jgi:DNA end-binding protein Ku
MPNALWTGSLVFGLVNVPVELLPAVRSRQLRFHMLRRQDGCRLRRKMVCALDGEEVAAPDTVSGFELEKGKYVTFAPGELDALEPQRSRALEISDFVAIEEIDPVYYDRAYYLAPGEDAGKAYVLLARALREAGRVGIGKLIMHNREYLTAIRPGGRGLVLQILHDAAEVRAFEEVVPLPENLEVPAQQLQLARQLIEALTAKFEPAKYHDDFRQRVEEAIAAKAQGQAVVQPPVAEVEEGVYDLLAALEKSVAAAQKKPRREPRRQTA